MQQQQQHPQQLTLKPVLGLTRGVDLVVEREAQVRWHVAVCQEEGAHPARPSDDHLPIRVIKVYDSFQPIQTHRQQVSARTLCPRRASERDKVR